MEPLPPFRLRVDWGLADAHGGWVPVDLYIGDDAFPKTIHYERTPYRAVAWAVSWFQGRGITWSCDVDTHQRLGHQHITMYATGRVEAPHEGGPRSHGYCAPTGLPSREEDEVPG
jgi:hypothetical protein